ncbi:MAG: 3'-5' exonuclease domain-containing protein 2 [Bacteroidales bacterium]|nr:3'-5' exonuclease domain-containing protein 2 [Bacteroidales bacterium]
MQNDEYLKFQGEIIVTSATSQNFSYALSLLNKHQVIGFDTETKPSFKKGVNHLPSLIQLATPSVVILYQIRNKPIAKEIIAILENKEIVKVGAGIHQDIRNLQKITSFVPQAFVDIQTIAKELSIEKINLKKLTELLLEKKLSKRQQLSNWGAVELSEAQKLYAATDAYACLLIYEKLVYEITTNTNKKK